ncbi:MAG: peptide chain release factor N(5)-glutamine methyltransferase [Acetatifactor sp.]|nr:peptide chain release factor N(5)-glutamine methyltransferase [Acetatifactor sp.]
MTYGEVFEEGKRRLTEAAIEEAVLDARLLLEHVCGTDRNTLLAHADRLVTEEDRLRYQELIKRRASRIPLQQLTGVQNFMGLDFLVNEHVLIPRQDTEFLVEEVLKNLHDGMRVLDLCTGTGCILISLLRYTNDCQGLGVDISPEALAVAKMNARRLLTGNGESAESERRGHLQFLESDLYERVEGIFDIIVSNPPYIPTEVIDTLMPEVREHEPRLALDGSEDGLLFYRRIIEGCRTHLKGGGMLFFEIGHDQGAAVSELMEQAGFLEVQVTKDYAGLDRVVSGLLEFEPLKR